RRGRRGGRLCRDREVRPAVPRGAAGRPGGTVVQLVDRIPALNGMGWHMANSLHNQRILALVFMVVVTVFNVYGVRVVALINNIGVIFHTSGTNATVGTF